MKSVLYSLLLFVGINSVAQEKTANWQILNRPGYSLEHPANWRLDTAGRFGTDIFLFSPLLSKEDKFSENLNVVIQDTTGLNITPEKAIELSIEQVKTIFTNGALVETKKLTRDGKTFYKLVFTGQQGIFNIKTTQHYHFTAGKAYIVTLTLLQETYDAYIETGDRILNSLNIK